MPFSRHVLIQNLMLKIQQQLNYFLRLIICHKVFLYLLLLLKAVLILIHAPQNDQLIQVPLCFFQVCFWIFLRLFKNFPICSWNFLENYRTKFPEMSRTGPGMFPESSGHVPDVSREHFLELDLFFPIHFCNLFRYGAVV